MPMAATSDAVAPALASTARQQLSTVPKMSSASCSTWPEAGKCCGSSSCASAATEPSCRTSSAREEVVPWSMARM